MVVPFLAEQADASVNVATIRRRDAAIHFRHASAEVESPTHSVLMAAASKYIRRELGVAPARKAPATARRLVEMVRQDTDDEIHNRRPPLMKIIAILSITLAASTATLAAEPLPHGASAVISGIACKTIDLTPNDGVAPYARLVTASSSLGPYFAGGALLASSGKEPVKKSRKGSGLESIYITLDSEGSSGTALIAPSSNGIAGLLSASSATAPGRVFDSYGFSAEYNPQFRLGPNSGVECKAKYVITAWSKQVAGAPDIARSEASVATLDLQDGENTAVVYHAEAYGNPVNGKRYEQKSGQITLNLYNYGGGPERMAWGAFQAFVSGGQP